MAVAVEQEMKAKSQDAKAKVILAEAEVPKAMASALQKGHVGVKDYYRMQNMKAATDMRSAISGEGANNQDTGQVIKS